MSENKMGRTIEIMVGEAFEARCRADARLAMGREFRVRHDGNATAGGVIVLCEYAGLRGRSAAWRVVLQAPNGAQHGPFIVTRIPR